VRRALVTGATGGLGLALAAALTEAGYEVRATGRDTAVFPRLHALGCETVPADLTRPDVAPALCAGMDVVFHAAALSSPWGTWPAFHAINVAATNALLAAAKAAGADNFVFVSSPSVYARLADQVGLTEKDPPARKPMNAYAATKLAAERDVIAAAAPGFAASAIRPRALVGPDDTVLLPRVLRVVKRGTFPLLRGGKALVELTDVRDAAHALVLADQHRAQASGQVFNISGGQPTPVRALAERLAQALGRPIRFRPVPLSLVMAAAALSEAVCAALPGRPEPSLTVYGVSTLAYSQTFDLSLARTVLGYSPQFDATQTAFEVARTWAAETVA
jgi:nucleoside-diphosphate-sugar epimerase